MNTLVNERVHHAKFGAGIILEETQQRVCIQFEQCKDVKLFVSPNSFECFLQLQDQILQEQYYNSAVQQRKEKEQLIYEQNEAAKRDELMLRLTDKNKKKVVRRTKTTKVATTKKVKEPTVSTID